MFGLLLRFFRVNGKPLKDPEHPDSPMASDKPLVDGSVEYSPVSQRASVQPARVLLRTASRARGIVGRKHVVR